jgi:hypothetical protein
MRRKPLLAGVSQAARGRGASSVACIAFVAAVGVAFWAGAVWIGEQLLRIAAAGY